MLPGRVGDGVGRGDDDEAEALEPHHGLEGAEVGGVVGGEEGVARVEHDEEAAQARGGGGREVHGGDDGGGGQEALGLWL